MVLSLTVMALVKSVESLLGPEDEVAAALAKEPNKLGTNFRASHGCACLAIFSNYDEDCGVRKATLGKEARGLAALRRGGGWIRKALAEQLPC